MRRSRERFTHGKIILTKQKSKQIQNKVTTKQIDRSALFKTTGEDMDDGKMSLLSEKGTSALMKLMMQRGYFHEDDTDLVETENGGYIRLDHLLDCFCGKIETMGRCTVEKAAGELGVAANHIRNILPNALQRNPTLLCVEEEFITKKYLQETVTEVVSTLDLSGGKVLLSDIAHDTFRLPLDTVARVLNDQLPGIENHGSVEIRTLHNGAKVLVTQRYLNAYKKRVLDYFGALKRPVSVESTALENDWESEWINEFLLLEVQQQGAKLPGELHGDSYVPHAFTEQLQQSVRSNFTSRGFVTTGDCQLIGMLPAQMKLYIKESFPAAVILKESVINPDAIIAPLEAAIQETRMTGGFLDIEEHLPVELTSNKEDKRMIVFEHILSKADTGTAAEAPGVAVVLSSGALYASQLVIDEIASTIIPSLVESFAHSRARKIDEAVDGLDTLEPNLSAKDKRKAKRASKLTKQQAKMDRHCVDDEMVPLIEIVQAIAKAYPELSEFISQANTDGEAKHIDKEGILDILCRQAFYTDDFLTTCTDAVRAELKRLQSLRASKARVNKRDAASKIQSVDVAFEDPSCFAAACYSIQARSKFLKYAMASKSEEDTEDEEMVKDLENDFLRGCCADFMSRVTAYCLFKHEVADGIFSFGVKEEDECGKSRFCSPVDHASRRFPPIFMACTEDDNGKPRDPLPTLRNLLPQSVGINLARQWILCGGECYHGGSKIADNGDVFTRPGDVEGFLSFVEENCLTVCGLPFKKLDKKAEKQLLFARRQELSHLLEESSDPEAVLELAVMLLFQLCKVSSHLLYTMHSLIQRSHFLPLTNSLSLFCLFQHRIWSCLGRLYEGPF